MTLTVSCPTCQKQVTWNETSPLRPFCSKRCQLVDIGDWADESNKISQPLQGATQLNEEMLDALEAQFLQQNKFFVDAD